MMRSAASRSAHVTTLAAFVVACGDGAVADVAPASDAAPDAAPFPEETLDGGMGTRFADLYRDLFGSTAAASCAGDGACHGASDEPGAVVTGGYVCADEPGCHASMTALLVGDGGATAPEETRLYRALRRRRDDGTLTGSMPRRPGYVFSRASLERVKTWIRNGAPKD